MLLHTLAQEFNVVSLSQLVHWLKLGTKFLARTVVITFDDGYKDNFLLAAPLLEEHKLPACFFVVTDAVSTGKATWKGAQKAELMTWFDVKQLAERGFEVGSHTCSHRSLNTLSVNEIRQELRISKDIIEQHISQEVKFFAYPFGGRSDIASVCVEELKKVGYDCCLSAFGGVVFPGQDPFALRRVSISGYHSSQQHLGRELDPFLSIFRTLKDDLRSICLPFLADR